MIEGIFSVSKVVARPIGGRSLLRVTSTTPPKFRKFVRMSELSPAADGATETEEIRREPAVIGSSKYHDLQSYLEYAKHRKLDTDSSVFQGNLYELNFLEFLRRNFAVSRLIHQGGKDDKGIDIRAMWRPVDNFGLTREELSRHYETVNSVTRVKPIALKKDSMIRLFVQCKSWEKSRIDAKMIREINGTVNSMGKANKNKKFLMFVCPTGFTRQGRMDFDRSLVPLVFIRFSKSQLIDRADPYASESYKLGAFESFYCNPMANALLKGLDWMDFMKRLGAQDPPTSN